MGLKFKTALLNYDKNSNATAKDFDGYAANQSDSVDLTNGPTRAIYVGSNGNIKVSLLGGGTAVLTSVVAGQILPIAATRIWSTSTTSTGNFALYD